MATRRSPSTQRPPSLQSVSTNNIGNNRAKSPGPPCQPPKVPRAHMTDLVLTSYAAMSESFLDSVQHMRAQCHASRPQRHSDPSPHREDDTSLVAPSLVRTLLRQNADLLAAVDDMMRDERSMSPSIAAGHRGATVSPPNTASVCPSNTSSEGSQALWVCKGLCTVARELAAHMRDTSNRVADIGRTAGTLLGPDAPTVTAPDAPWGEGEGILQVYTTARQTSMLAFSVSKTVALAVQRAGDVVQSLRDSREAETLLRREVGALTARVAAMVARAKDTDGVCAALEVSLESEQSLRADVAALTQRVAGMTHTINESHQRQQQTTTESVAALAECRRSRDSLRADVAALTERVSMMAADHAEEVAWLSSEARDQSRNAAALEGRLLLSSGTDMEAERAQHAADIAEMLHRQRDEVSWMDAELHEARTALSAAHVLWRRAAVIVGEAAVCGAGAIGAQEAAERRAVTVESRNTHGGFSISTLSLVREEQRGRDALTVSEGEQWAMCLRMGRGALAQYAAHREELAAALGAGRRWVADKGHEAAAALEELVTARAARDDAVRTVEAVRLDNRSLVDALGACRGAQAMAAMEKARLEREAAEYGRQRDDAVAAARDAQDGRHNSQLSLERRLSEAETRRAQLEHSVTQRLGLLTAHVTKKK